MDSIRTHQRISSFLFSAMLTSAFLTTAPQNFQAAAVGPNLNNLLSRTHLAGWYGSSNTPAAVPTPQAVAYNGTASVPQIPDAKLKKINDILIRQGADRIYGPTYLTPLGLPSGPSQFRQLGIKINSHSDTHLYIPLSDGGMILSLITPQASFNYRLDASFNVIKAVEISNHQYYEIADPAAGAHAEIDFWIYFADNS